MEETMSLQSLSQNEMDYSSSGKAFTFSVDRVVPLNNDHPGKDGTKKDTATQTRTSLSIAEAFCNTTTAHGWGRVHHGTTAKVKVLWLLLTTCALVVNIGHITILVEQYLDFPYEQISQVELEELPFPRHHAV